MEITKHRGFTLLEVLTVVTILGFILITITQLLGTTISGASKSRSLQNVKEDGQFIVSTMERTVRRAKEVTACAGTTLIVIVPEVAGDTTYTFAQNGTTMTRNGEQISAPTSEVTSFSCSLTPAANGQPAVVVLSLTLRRSSLSPDENAASQTFTTSVSLRTY